MARAFFLLLGALFTVPAAVQAEILTAELMNVEKGLPSNRAYFALQDRHGFLWIAAVPGLARFDGRNWEYFRSERANRSGPSSLNVYGMCEDRRGNLWLATSLGLNRFAPRNRSFRYYFYDPRDPASLGPGEVLCVHILSRQPDTLWIGTMGDGLNSMDLRSGRIRRWLPRDGITDSGPGMSTYLMLEDRRGRLWSASQQGLNCYDPGRRSFSFHRPPIPSIQGKIPEITCIFESSSHSGILWISTLSAGLLSFDTRTGNWRVFSRGDGRTGLPSDDVYMITDWPGGGPSLLLSTAEGFCRFDPRGSLFSPVTLIADGQEVPKQTGYMYTCRTSGGVLWLTSIYYGVFKIIPHESNPVTYRESPARDAPEMNSLAEDGRGRIWMSCNSINNRYSVWSYEPRTDTFSRILASAPERIAAQAKGIFCARDGSVWIGTSDGLVRVDPQSGRSTAVLRSRPPPAASPGALRSSSAKIHPACCGWEVCGGFFLSIRQPDATTISASAATIRCICWRTRSTTCWWTGMDGLVRHAERTGAL